MALVQSHRKQRSNNYTRPSMPSSFWWLMAGFGLVRSGGCVMLFLSFYLSDHLKYSNSMSGWVASLFGTGWIVGLALAGWAIDKFGRRLTLVFSLVGASVSYMALGHAPNRDIVMLAAFAAGMFFDVNRTVVTTVITDILPESRRKDGFGYQYMVVNAATGISAIAGGLLAMHDYTWIFWFNSFMSLAFLAFMLSFQLEGPKAQTISGYRVLSGKKGGYGVVFSDWLFMSVFVASFLFFLVFSQFLFTMPIVMSQDGLSSMDYGLVSMAVAFSVVLMQPFLKRWVTGRFRSTSVATAGCLVMGVGMTFTALSTSPMSYIVSSWLWLPGEIIFVISAQFIVSAIAPPDALGRYNGLWGTASGIATLLAPVLGTAALNFAGKEGLALICMVAGIAGALICLAVSPQMHKRAPSLAEVGIR